MNNKLIIANWKMNGTKDAVNHFIQEIERVETQHQIILCLPHPYLHLVTNKQNHKLHLGAQDCHSQTSGSHTGDVSPAMLSDIGCKYVILGHSERRKEHNESNATVKAKATSAEKHNLTPIIAVGENKEEDDIQQILQSCEESLCNECIIGYEPIWAIGSGLTPTLDKIHHITNELRRRYKKPVVYGGSVNEDNAAEILNITSVSGLLIGKSSMNVEKFIRIIRS